jgi:hypothetical protein
MKRPNTRRSWIPSRSGFPQLGLRDVIAIGAVLALVVAALVGNILYFPTPPKTNSTFGPDWDCKPLPYGPVCVRRIDAAK